MAGRRTGLIEDWGGALERPTAFAYNPLDQIIRQTSPNKASTGTPLAEEITDFRYDSLGRQTRVVYPDSGDDPDGPTCLDCVEMLYDAAGRLTQRRDQRQAAFAATLAYDDRGLMLTRTTGTARDTFAYDAVGRVTVAERGTPGDPDAVSRSAMAYSGRGDLLSEVQTIAGGTARTVGYAHDQAGNRVQLAYPGGESLNYTPTAINQVDDMTLTGGPAVDYLYAGRMLDQRTTTTDAPGGTTWYEVDMGYDGHRRTNAITNRLQSPGRGLETLADYGFTHDDSGNPLTQTAEGLAEPGADFAVDDRVFNPDRLNRLTDTQYLETGSTESTVLDLVGNREAHTNRAGDTTDYTLANACNEYNTINGQPVEYDAAGNLTVDEAGRQYSYDEQNRLTQIKAVDNTALAAYAYDALGRRVASTLDGVTTRYYYDGHNIIEERDGSDQRVRYHVTLDTRRTLCVLSASHSRRSRCRESRVNGAQYVDEHVATFALDAPPTLSVGMRSIAPPEADAARQGSGAGEFTYYLLNQSFSVAGTGSADGSVIERLDYSATGDFTSGTGTPTGLYFDADFDGDIDLKDFANFQNCFASTTPACLDMHDYDANGQSNGLINLADWAGFAQCLNGPDFAPLPGCELPPARVRGTATSGGFTLHGRPIDVLPDGQVLMNFRNRIYDPEHGRWSQRDRRGYADGAGLYESFRGNPATNADPMGEGVLTWLFAGRYDASDWEFIKRGGPAIAAYGFAEGGVGAVASGARELSRIPSGESEAQKRLVALVEAEHLYGGTDNALELSLRATGQGIVDFFGASNVAIAATGEAVVFIGPDQEGGPGVYLVDVGGFERLQAGVGGVGQFAGSVSALGGGGLSQAKQLQIARFGLQAAARLAPASRTSQALFLRAGLAIERAQFALETTAVSGVTAFVEFGTRGGLTSEMVRMQLIVAQGELGEAAALQLQSGLGEITVATQFQQGAARLRQRFGCAGGARPPGLRKRGAEPNWCTVSRHLQRPGPESAAHIRYQPISSSDSSDVASYGSCLSDGDQPGLDYSHLFCSNHRSARYSDHVKNGSSDSAGDRLNPIGYGPRRFATMSMTMSTLVSYAEKYYARWAPYQASWDKVIADDLNARNWDLQCDLPGEKVSGEVRLALQCLYAGDRQRAELFLQRAIRNADRLVQESRYLGTEIAEAGHPRNLAQILRGRTYAAWLLGEQLDRKKLLQAGKHFITWCLTKAEDRNRIDDSLTMNCYLQGVRASMIASDLDYAAEALRTKHEFRWHHARERELWTGLIEQYPEMSDEFDAEFESFFDLIRDPDFKDVTTVGPVLVEREWLALESAMIREMYIVNASPRDDPDPDPQAVVAAVAR